MDDLFDGGGASRDADESVAPWAMAIEEEEESPGYPQCPRCGSQAIAVVLWGEPSPDVEADILAGRLVLGGCVVEADPPTHQCTACGLEFAR